MSDKPTILTGLRANEDLTIGNYFGAMLPMIDMARQKAGEYRINMFIPDLHSFTTPINHSKLYDQILHNARLFVAAGLPLDDDNILLYRQSYVPAHSELTWILDCFTGFGEMRRMTQFKEKSVKYHKPGLADVFASLQNNPEYESKNDILRYIEDRLKEDRTTEDASVGLFNYPVLMAADILLYNALYVPVGDDQTQHLEFTRDIAMRINNRFSDVFTVPKSVPEQHAFFGKDQGLRIMDLVNPTKKMSKSDESGKGVIFLGDEPSVAAKKIMAATTDDKAEIHFDRINQPGISNLLEILSLLRGRPLAATIAEFEGQTRYGDFKKLVASEMESFLADFQQRLANVNESDILAKLKQSEHEAARTANATLLRTQQAVGLRRKE
jgi:tryptophanyl-tRNA synthetase